MTTLTLTTTRIKEGVWHGVIKKVGGGEPQIDAVHQDMKIADVSLQKNENSADWALRVPIPPQAISDGVQTLVVRDSETAEPLGHITLLAGEVLADDIRAEIDLLRAELDMLKRAFRRHCVETA